MSEFYVRFISSIILIPLVLIILWVGSYWFLGLITLITVIAGYEWSRLCNITYPLSKFLLLLLGPFIIIAFVIGGFSVGIIVFILFLIISVLTIDKNIINKVWTFMGLFYLGLPALSIAVLRSDSHFGLQGVLFLFVMVWLTDVGGYVFGRFLGGPKLAPLISPGKTWAGSFGAVILPVGFAYVVFLNINYELPIDIVLCAIIISISSQFGDLFESCIKRIFNKKNSGNLIPGHGGLLDRIDGLLMASTVMIIILISKTGTLLLWP